MIFRGVLQRENEEEEEEKGWVTLQFIVFCGLSETLANRILFFVFHQLQQGGLAQVYLAHVSEPEKVEKHVRELLPEVVLLLIRELREISVNLALPLTKEK